MNFLKSTIIISILITILSTVNKDIIAQQWVTDMQDTSLT